jgi:hypothetical protein
MALPSELSAQTDSLVDVFPLAAGNQWTYGYFTLIYNWPSGNPVETRTDSGLFQTYPNPFNPVTTINFSVPSGRDLVRGADGQFSIVNRQLTILNVYDVLGREVATLVNEEKPPGTYVTSYFCRLSTGGYIASKKMLLIR